MSSLVLADVVKHYRSGDDVVRAVDDVSLTVGPSEFVAIYGPSGSGKTTLLLIAAGLIEPDRGNVTFDGEAISKLSERDASSYRRYQLGLVRQTFHLNAGLSALDNAAEKLLGTRERLSPNEAADRARPWLERVGLGKRAHHRPKELSTGECQRVAIARALACDPELVLADEPTGNLDTKRTGEMLTLLRSICKERAIPMVLVTHDELAADYVDRVCTLTDGRLTDGLNPVSAEPLSK